MSWILAFLRIFCLKFQISWHTFKLFVIYLDFQLYFANLSLAVQVPLTCTIFLALTLFSFQLKLSTQLSAFRVLIWTPCTV